MQSKATEIGNRGNVRNVANRTEKPSIYLIDLKERENRKMVKEKNSKESILVK